MEFEPRELLDSEKAADRFSDYEGGYPRKDYNTLQEIWCDVMSPFIDLLTKKARVAGITHGVKGTVVRFLLFRVLLGMIQPRRIDDVWVPKALSYNARLSQLLTRREYYRLNRVLRPDVTLLIERCNEVWGSLWRLGAVASGDETVVPHKGVRAGPLRQFIPRKPHSTGVKLYVLADAVEPYVTNVYLYVGARGQLRRASTVQGNMNARQIVNYWADVLPEGTILVADSFFGSHEAAKGLAARGTPFLMLCKRDERGVSEAGEVLEEGGLATAKVSTANYTLQVYKNPRVGHKPPRVVPLLSNCGFPQEVVVHKKRGYEMPAIIGCYRALAGGVDTANQLALQHRETGRFRKWSAAVRSFLMRYAMVNIFTMAKCSKLVKPGTTMWEFQWDLLTTLIDIEVPETPQAIHVPVEANRAACVHCGKRCATQCAACRQNLHVRCFAQWHLNQ